MAEALGASSAERAPTGRPYVAGRRPTVEENAIDPPARGRDRNRAGVHFGLGYVRSEIK